MFQFVVYLFWISGNTPKNDSQAADFTGFTYIDCESNSGETGTRGNVSFLEN